MKQEASLLAQKLEQLKQIYHGSHCVQCEVMQQHIKKEYHVVKVKLASLERMLQSNDISDLSLVNLQQSSALFGLYVMV